MKIEYRPSTSILDRPIRIFAHPPKTTTCVYPQLCLTLYCPLDYSPAGSSDHGISQARIPSQKQGEKMFKATAFSHWEKKTKTKPEPSSRLLVRPLLPNSATSDHPKYAEL